MAGDPPAQREPVPLDMAVKNHAACPCERHTSELLDALAKAPELVLKATHVSGPVQPGTHTVSSDDQIQMATTTIPQGGKWLLTFPNIDAARRADANATYFGITLRELVRILQSDLNVDGILLVAATPDNAWAAINRETLYNLIRPS